MVVQHNMQAANASRMLGITTNAQGKSTEKLSSGFRINRAADDAAGLSISEKMRKQIRGLDQASTNASDGISAVQTAEGALTEVHSMLQRMNELAVQAANGTNSESDRASIQDEILQLTTEIDRVAETTKFNETYLLKGDYGTKTQVVAAHDAGLDGTLTQNTTKATFTINALAMGDTYTIGGTKYTIGVEGANTATQLANALTVLGTSADKTAQIHLTVGEVVKIDGKSFTIADKTNADTSEVAATELNKFASQGSTIEYNGKVAKLFSTSTGAAPADGVDGKDSTLITAAKAYQLIANELRAASSIGSDSIIEVPGAKYNGTDITVTDATSSTNVNGKKPDEVTGDNLTKVEFIIKKGTATVQKDLTFNLHVGSDADMTNKIGVTIESMTATALGIQGLNVGDATGKAATYAIDAIADALAKVSAQRSGLGAIQNRLEHSIANLDNVVENTEAAESRIRDTDMADEMVTYSKNNILAQAGQSMLAQANQATQGVLSLLG
ncbi:MULTISPECIES: flagellin N-terminal helical domain-containing protein [unclassified Pseudobutyrivibrio]|uniref:flagellin N-terminal helical domain-containing protein n=1 Tax=unclassified Pseudobutyrivibrio TaxID=2638619 RepID=UPI0005D1AC3C|nr:MULTISPECIES: flagellin [unclassified Pseudobutyrivibrio]SET03677.1 flagellin [Pseudobutyrivibrio sp. C4]